ncbi:hypothetical protein ACFQX7_39485 [Luedemannella flava]
MTAYAGPIGLTRALLGAIADGARVVRDPTVDAYHLVHTALLGLPDALVSGGELAGLAARSAPRRGPTPTGSRTRTGSRTPMDRRPRARP